MSIRKLISQTATYGMITIIVRFINYFMTPYFTNLDIFTESVYGVMGYYYSVIPFGLTILTMGLETGYFRFAGKSDTPSEGYRVFNTLTTTVIAVSSLFFIGCTLFSGEIYASFKSENMGGEILIPIVAAVIAIDAINSMFFARLRQEDKTSRFMKIKITDVIVNLVLCVFFYSVLPRLSSHGILSWLWNPNFGCGYVFISNLISSLVSTTLLAKGVSNFALKIDRKMLKTIFIFSIPIFAGSISGTANEFIDRQQIRAILPDDIATGELGIYTAAMKLASFIYLFTQMYKYAAEPFFLGKMKDNDFRDRNAQALKYFTIASLAIFLFITLFMDYFQLFIGERFREGVKIVPMLLTANILAGVLLNLSYWYKVSEKTYYMVLITAVGLAVTVLMNLILIPHIGYTGAAWSRIGSGAVMVVMSYLLGRKHMKIEYDIKSIAIYTLLTIALYYCFKLLDIEMGVVKVFVSSLFFTIFVVFFAVRENLLSLVADKINSRKNRSIKK